MLGRLLAALLVFLAAACGGGPQVARIVDGHLVQGRFVQPEAYAAYLSGVIHENRGDLLAAEAAYVEAIRYDPHGAEIWARIGAVRCARGMVTPALDAFRRADEIDPETEEVWTARARCHLGLGQTDLALAAALRAVALDPDRPDPIVLLARILEHAGRLDEALLWMDGLVLRDPSSAPAQRAMVDLAARTGDDPRRLAAMRALEQIRGDGFAKATISDVDDALLRGDTERARRLAVAAGVVGGALALRAVALGQSGFAREQAEIAAGADPSDSDARIAAAVAADLAGNDAALSKALSGLEARMTQPSPLGRALLAELVERRCGIGLEPESPRKTDPLLSKVIERGRPTPSR